MQPSPTPRDRPARPAGRTPLLVGLAIVAVLAFSSPASALMLPTRDRPTGTVQTDGGVWVDVRPESQGSMPVSAEACISHDSEWNEIPWVDEDDNGDPSLYVPRQDPSDGSDKANASCVRSPGGGVTGGLFLD